MHSPRAELPERRPATEDEVRALASPLRLRILRVCLGEARTNKEIAQVLGKDPASTLHHVRRLADTGFIKAQPVRRGTRGSREITYLSTGKSWSLSTPAKDRHLLDTFIEEVSLVPAESMPTTRLGLRLSPERKIEFEQRLMELFEEFRVRSAAEASGDPWSVFFAIHPDPNKPAAG